MLALRGTEEQRKAYAEAMKRTTVFLGQVASLLASKKFYSWYSSDEARFDWATPRVQGKLRKDLMFQVNQVFDLRLDKTVDTAERFLLLAERCKALGAAAEFKHGIKNTKKEKQFTFTRGCEPADLIFGFLSKADTYGFIRDLEGGFYVWNAVSSLVTYVRARETLACPTNNETFERILQGLSEDYMVNGYPHDLIAHDAHDVRNGAPIRALLIRDEYCSTQLVRKGEELLPFSGGQVIHFTKAA